MSSDDGQDHNCECYRVGRQTWLSAGAFKESERLLLPCPDNACIADRSMTEKSGNAASGDMFSEEEKRFADLSERMSRTDWTEPESAEKASQAALDDFKWLLRRFRRAVKMADLIDHQLKTALAQEAEQKRELEETNARLRETRDELVRAEKLAALGGMVAGIAHEINTPLGIIRTAASTLAGETKRLEQLAAGGQARKSDVFAYFSTAREATALMEANSERSAELIRSFKEVAVDKTSDVKRRFLLAGYIREVLQTLTPELKKTVLKTVVDGDEAVELDSYPGAVAQIVSILVINSIRHGFSEGQSGSLRFEVRQAGPDTVMLCYSDDGCGVAPEIRAQMFDPFVTTKRGQGGSGLGLHILHNIVVGKLGGRIEYRDTLGGGATFVMEFRKVAGAT
jgi:signal transduction histidine kinase